MSALSSTTRMSAPCVPPAGSAGRDVSCSQLAASPRAASDGASEPPSATASGAPNGSATVNVLPVPGSLSTETEPPCRAASSCTRASPMPVPSRVRAVAPGTRWKRWNSCGSCSATIPTPVSVTVSTNWSLVGPQRDVDAPDERVLHRVGEQVDDDLLPHPRIDVGRLLQRRAVHGQPQPGALGGGPEDAGQLGGERGDVGLHPHGHRSAGLDAGEVEQVVDQPLQALPVAQGQAELLLHRRPAAARPGR